MNYSWSTDYSQLVVLNKLRCHAYFYLSANQFARSILLIQINTLNDKQCISRSSDYRRSQLIWSYTLPQRQGISRFSWTGTIIDNPNIFSMIYMYAASVTHIAIRSISTHLCLTSQTIDTGKQCRPRSDAAERGFWSGSTLLTLKTGIAIKHGCNKN